jgi:uncharacterized protein (TIGR02271 family)
MAYEKIVTLFDTAEHAEIAKRHLELAGFSSGDISIASKNTLGDTGETLREPGLWHKLFGSDIQKHEASVYGNTVEAGGVVLTLRAADSDVPKAMGILHEHQAVDVERRAAERGLIGTAAAAAGAAAGDVRRGVASTAASTPAAAASTSAPAASAGPTPRVAAAISTGNRDEVLRLAEEQLNVGKRLVEQGTTRIRRFVTEKPVEQKVTLHEEHAEVVRRAVANPASLGEIDWEERTIEVRETAEEAVVSKTAHITEEVVIGKTGSDREQTVRDTVRRQQVEVEKIPSKGEEGAKADAAKKA